MSYEQIVLRDNPIGFWPLNESSGNNAFDYSGCTNHGLYLNYDQQLPYHMPLVLGSDGSTQIDSTTSLELPITKNYTGVTTTSSFGDRYSSDNSFSLEIWIYPKKTIELEYIPLLDNHLGVGISWLLGEVYFNLGSESISYLVPNSDKRIHIVGVYEKDTASLYVDGKLVYSLFLTNFKFTNDQFEKIYIGPTTGGDKILIDYPAVYRYALNPIQIANHFNASAPTMPEQIVLPDDGILFKATDSQTRKGYSYSYPANRPWKSISATEISYNQMLDALVKAKNGTEDTLYDSIYVPAGLSFVSSKVEWDSDNGVEVYVTFDPDAGYELCSNGSPLPIWTAGNLGQENTIYIKIVFTSSAQTILKNLKFDFYSEKNIYAINSGNYISLEQPLYGNIDLTEWDFSIPSEYNNSISRSKRAGIRPVSQAGFGLNSDIDINTIELTLFFPDIIADGTIFSHDNAWLSWDVAGTANYNNISTVYLNGVGMSPGNLISQFEPGEVCHLVIVLDQPITGKIYFNSLVQNGVWSNSSTGYAYDNIAIYDYAIGSEMAALHSNLYHNMQSANTNNVSFAMTENGTYVYNNDWQAVKTF